jgi:hypothetical protein
VPDDTPTVSSGDDLRTRPGNLHLESALRGGMDKSLSMSYRPRSEGHFHVPDPPPAAALNEGARLMKLICEKTTSYRDSASFRCTTTRPGVSTLDRRNSYPTCSGRYSESLNEGMPNLSVAGYASQHDHPPKPWSIWVRHPPRRWIVAELRATHLFNLPRNSPAQRPHVPRRGKPE